MAAPKLARTFKSREVLRWLWQEKEEPLPEPPIIIEGLLREGSNLVVAGTAGIGKSLFCTQLAECLACGIPFLGMNIGRRYRVLYAQAEMNEWSVGSRLAIQGNIVIPPDVDWHDIKMAWWSNKPWRWDAHQARLLEVIDETDCEILILDPLSRVKPSRVAENDNDEMGAWLNETINGIMVEKKLLGLILVHHTGKPNELSNRDPLDLLRGASALRDWMESFVLIGGERHQPEGKLIFDKVRDFADKDDMKVMRRGLVFTVAEDDVPLVLAILADFEEHTAQELAEATGLVVKDVKAALKHLPVESGSWGYRLRPGEGISLLDQYAIAWRRE